MRSFIAFTAFCLAVAGHATALILQFGPRPANVPNPNNPIGNITASQLINNSSVASTNCQSECSSVISAFAACGDNNDACLCDNTTVVQPLYNCEQCMFTNLIEMNMRPPEPTAGSAVLLSTYAAACAASNITVNSTLTTLVLPSTWDGPRDIILNTGETIFTVALGAIIGSGAIAILCTM